MRNGNADRGVDDTDNGKRNEPFGFDSRRQVFGFQMDFQRSHHFVIAPNVLQPPSLIIGEGFRRHERKRGSVSISNVTSDVVCTGI